MTSNTLDSGVQLDGIVIGSGFGPVTPEEIGTWSGLEYLMKILDDEVPQPSIHRALNFRLIEIDEGRAVFTGVPTADYLNPMGTIHGGYVSALLDSAMACSAHSLCPRGTANTTVEMKVSFVRPVLAETGRLYASGAVVNAGRTITTTEGQLRDETGKLYAHGSQTCMRVALE